MPEIQCLHGSNFADGTDKLIAIRNGVIYIYDPNLAVWKYRSYPTFTSSLRMDTENFLDHSFFVNGTDFNYSYNDNGYWSKENNLHDSPKAKYIKEYKLKLYLGNIVIRGTSYPSRVWFSDLPKDNEIQWGIETGTNLVQTAASAIVTSTGSTFETNNIKVGDTFLIENGNNSGEYTVRTVDSQTQITLTEVLTYSATGGRFWTGRNYFDVKTDNGDVITGFGRNSNELLIFKKLSLHRYNVDAGTLRQVKEVPGTTSPASIVDEDEFTYYYDSKSDAIRRYGGGTSIIISNAVEDLLQNISSSMRDSVIGWQRDGKYIEFYIGDTTTRDGYSISKCVLVWDTISEIWSTRSLPVTVEASTEWIQNDKSETYIGTSTEEVLKINSGYSYDGTAIAFELIDKPIFPLGPDALVDFQRVRFYIDNGYDMQIMYRILYAPIDNYSWRHTDWFPMEGKSSSARVEFSFKNTLPHRGSGVQFRFIQSSVRESFLLEKYIVYYSNPGIR